MMDDFWDHWGGLIVVGVVAALIALQLTGVLRLGDAGITQQVPACHSADDDGGTCRLPDGHLFRP